MNCPTCGKPAEYNHCEKGYAVYSCYRCKTCFNREGQDLDLREALTEADWEDNDLERVFSFFLYATPEDLEIYVIDDPDQPNDAVRVINNRTIPVRKWPYVN